MRLPHKKLLMLLADGVDQVECEQLRRGFEEEGAEVLYTSPANFPYIETVAGNRRGRDLLIDVPFDAVTIDRFDGLIIPDGYISTVNAVDDGKTTAIIQEFHKRGLPIFASGQAVQLLYASRVLSQCILVREGEPMTSFINEAVGVLLDAPLPTQPYRATTAS